MGVARQKGNRCRQGEGQGLKTGKNVPTFRMDVRCGTCMSFSLAKDNTANRYL